MHALSDRVRDHAIDADARQDQRERGEEGDQGGSEPRLCDRCGEALFQRADPRHRQFAVDRSDLVANGGGETERIGGLGLDGEKNVPRCRLDQRLVNRGLRLARQPGVLHIANDAGDLPYGRLPLVSRVYALADGVLIREELARQRFVDNRRPWGVAGIGGVEITPAAQRNVERAEVVNTYTDHIGYRRRLIRGGWTPFNCEIVREFRAVGRQTVARRRGAHAGQPLDPFEQTGVERGDLLWVGVLRPTQRKLHS